MTDLEILKKIEKELNIVIGKDSYKINEKREIYTLYLYNYRIFNHSLIIKKLSILKELKNLQNLYLSFNKITDISFLKNLKNLQNLHLSVNKITDISFLKDLKDLKDLDLSDNKITDISFLKDLKNLNTLNLIYNPIIDLSLLKEFKNVKIHLGKIEKGYLKEIEIKNYFSIKEIKIENLENKKEIYFLGENGEGKTILLKSILIALKNSFKTINDNHLTEIKDNAFFKAKDNSYINYQFSKKEKNIKNTFKNIFAYGVSRLLTSKNKNATDETGYMSLFDNDTVLQHPILWLEYIDRLELKNIGQLKLKNVLKTFESLLENKIKIEEIKETGEFIFIEKGTKLKFEHLADGYKSILIWLSDLLFRLTNNQMNVKNIKDFHGIVLVDEIDILLHPRWQYKIVKKLRNLFPNIQWIFTTHSPIIILGASKDSVFYKVYKENGETKVSQPLKNISNLMANTVLTSPLFAMESARQINFDIETENLSLDDDFSWAKIHEAVSLKIQKENNLKEEDIMDFIFSELNNFENDKNK